MGTTLENYSARTAGEYLGTRVGHRIEAYRRKGNFYRYTYLTMASVSAIAAATVPVLINLDQVDTLYPTLLSLVVTVLVSLEGLYHFREHWKNYDLMKTYLRQETCLFQARAGHYRGCDDQQAFTSFVERIEDAIAKERSQTINMRTSRPQADQGGAHPAGDTARTPAPGGNTG